MNSILLFFGRYKFPRGVLPQSGTKCHPRSLRIANCEHGVPEGGCDGDSWAYCFLFPAKLRLKTSAPTVK